VSASVAAAPNKQLERERPRGLYYGDKAAFEEIDELGLSKPDPVLVRGLDASLNRSIV
jgi:hypothetical protein